MEYTQKQVESILAIAAHEVSSPLAALKMSIDMIERTCACPDRRHITMARRAIKRTDVLIKELLDASYMASGGVTYHMDAVSIEKALQNVVDEIKYHTDHACTIRVNVVEPEIYVRGDGGKIEQVLTNLISNACKYAPGKPIDVVVSRKEDIVQIEVRDHGEGIAADKLEIIFEKFQRDMHKQIQVHGLGLGLWICREIISKHGGTIFARNIENNGAAFIVQLPLMRG